MRGTISKLLEAYENGKMSRRDLVQGLALMAAVAGTASAAGFQSKSPPEIPRSLTALLVKQ